MRIDDHWCVHHATLLGAGVEVRAAHRNAGLAPNSEARFAYVVTSERELLPHAEVLQRINQGVSRPRIVRIGLRKSFDAASQLANEWARR